MNGFGCSRGFYSALCVIVGERDRPAFRQFRGDASRSFSMTVGWRGSFSIRHPEESKDLRSVVGEQYRHTHRWVPRRCFTFSMTGGVGFLEETSDFLEKSDVLVEVEMLHVCSA